MSARPLDGTALQKGRGPIVFDLSAVWSEVYGLKHLGSIRAVVVSAGVFASAAGPGVTGYLIDAGFYYPAQIVAMGCYCLLISLVMLYVSKRVRGRTRLPSQDSLTSPRL